VSGYLQAFRLQLLNDIRELVCASQPQPPREWLKSNEVRKLLKISSNTVQRLRISGKLKSTKLGGVHYYRREDIETLLETGA
jgi:hypothetical protein